ncbi:MAG: Stp1/IreP family PP2C-type Ser/Thr phosphatase [Streptosporangiales bacterium]|nr:Stp1/IreP family PP2C-type Ser/Thr phosphatase [Streptosporangiales bacterium]
MTYTLRYTAVSDVGLLRKLNEDSAYAGPHLVAVADGMGGHAHGEVASATAIATLARLDAEVPGSDLAGALRATIDEANSVVRSMVDADTSLEGMGTTVTALLYSNNRVSLGHIGDSRAYLLRDGAFRQVTKDHTLVQSMVDEGRITEEQAAVHPQRSLLLRALGTGNAIESDVNIHEARLGDRWLLCSDGLTSVVTEETIATEVARTDEIEIVAHRLIDLANRGGGPDNITCVIADVVDNATGPDHPVIVGAASEANGEPRRGSDSAAGRAAALTPPPEEPEEEEPEPRPRRRWAAVVWPVGAVLLIALLAFGSWQWAMAQFYVGVDRGNVAVFRGLAQPVGPVDVNRVEERTDVKVTDLPAYERERVENTIEVGSRADAFAAVKRLGAEADQCIERRKPTSTPTPRPSGSTRPTATPAPTGEPTGGCSP